jgi:hypothetical protein
LLRHWRRSLWLRSLLIGHLVLRDKLQRLSLRVFEHAVHSVAAR